MIKALLPPQNSSADVRNEGEGGKQASSGRAAGGRRETATPPRRNVPAAPLEQLQVPAQRGPPGRALCLSGAREPPRPQPAGTSEGAGRLQVPTGVVCRADMRPWFNRRAGGFSKRRRGSSPV